MLSRSSRSEARALSNVVRAVGRLGATTQSKLRRAIDRWLHPARHRRAERQLRSLERPRSILVLCDGNICRSPFLEALLRRSLPDIEVSSAGFIAVGRSVPVEAKTAALRRGLDLSSHRSRVVTRDMLRRSDLVIVMDPRQVQRLARGHQLADKKVVVAGDLIPMAGETRAIRDPWREPLEVFESSFTRLEHCASSVVGLLQQVSAPET